MNDVTFRMVLTLMLKNRWDSEVVDITTAFLYGDMEEQVFMSLPQGLEEVLDEEEAPGEDECLELLKTIYGTKQASRQYSKKFMQRMKGEGFQSIHADSCVLLRTSEAGLVIICVHVDDCFITGDSKAIAEAIIDIEKHFETRRLGKVDEYIGCTVQMTGEGKCVLIQPDMIKKIERDFGEVALKECSKERSSDTPMASQKMVERPDADSTLLSPAEQTKYRSCVGMLMYLVKHSRPDLSNAVRELTKVMDGATAEHWKMALKTVKFVLSTKNRGLAMEPTDAHNIEAYVDSDFAGDKGNRRSITGYLVYFCGVVVAWKSKQQGGVTLSSTEAEYYATSELATELLFVKQIAEFLQVPLQMPMVARVDNNGAIYLANNATSGARTKHVDTRVHFVRDLIQSEPPILESQFVGTADNQSDTYTKNTPTDVFWKHTGRYMVDVAEAKDLT